MALSEPLTAQCTLKLMLTKRTAILVMAADIKRGAVLYENVKLYFKSVNIYLIQVREKMYMYLKWYLECSNKKHWCINLSIYATVYAMRQHSNQLVTFWNTTLLIVTWCSQDGHKWHITHVNKTLTNSFQHKNIQHIFAALDSHTLFNFIFGVNQRAGNNNTWFTTAQLSLRNLRDR